MRTGVCEYEGCGVEFEDRSHRQHRRFCSARCRRDEYAHSEKARGHCVDCGVVLGVRAGPSGRPGLRCRACELQRRRDVVAARAHRIEAWWAEGGTLKSIAAELGWSVSHVRKEFDTLRGLGFDLPYRNSLSRPKYEEQVAA